MWLAPSQLPNMWVRPFRTQWCPAHCSHIGEPWQDQQKNCSSWIAGPQASELMRKCSFSPCIVCCSVNRDGLM
jgi:hypothetical protein